MSEQLTDHYDAMWLESINRFDRQLFEIDHHIQSPNDSRRGISLIIKHDSHLIAALKPYIQKLQHISPEQFYYPFTSLHITVLPIISCSQYFQLNQISINDYIVLIKDTVKHVDPFILKFKGVTASPSCVLAQGFPVDDKLLHLRGLLRQAFNQSSLKSTIDSRYKLTTAHSTICRFKQQILKPVEFTNVLKEIRTTEFSELHVNELYLVYNDWYHHADKTIVLSKISL